MKPSLYVAGLATVVAATAADAGDAQVGLRLAQSHCAVCHVVGQWRGDVLADAPPFAVIARKFPGSDLVMAIRGPHQKMNFRPSQSDANDIAEYIHSLAQ